MEKKNQMKAINQNVTMKILLPKKSSHKTKKKEPKLFPPISLLQKNILKIFTSFFANNSFCHWRRIWVDLREGQKEKKKKKNT